MNLPGVALASIVAVTSVLMGFRLGFLPMMPRLDPSYVYAFNHATVHGMLWGRDFISTYGPYGYLLQAVDVGDLALRAALGRLVLALASGLVATWYVRSVRDLSPAARLAACLALVYALAIQATHATSEYQWCGLFLLTLLTGLHAGRWGSVAALTLAGALAGLFLLLKLSLGFAAILTMTAAGALALSPGRILRRLVLMLGAAAIAVTLAWAGFYHTVSGLGAHLSLAFPVTAGYSSAMSLAPPWGWIAIPSFLLFLILLHGGVFLYGSGRARLSLLACVVPLVITWRHSVVRQDYPHTRLLVLFGLLVIAILIVDGVVGARRLRALALLCLAAVSLVVPWFYAGQRGQPLRDLVEAMTESFTLPGGVALWRLSHLGSYRREVARASEQALLRVALSGPQRTRIDSAQVDVYPWDQGHVPANGLVWHPRPSPASFGTYTPALDRLNAAFFRSAETRPRYVLWHLERGIRSIDRRHILWDEPQTLLAILAHYEVIQNGPTILLQERREPRCARRQLLGKVEVHWERWQAVPRTDGTLLAEVTLRRPWRARLRRVVFREEPVFASLRFSTGDTRTFRFIPDQAASGLWLTPFPRNGAELAAVLAGGPAGEAVALRFHGVRDGHGGPPLAVAWVRVMTGPEFC